MEELTGGQLKDLEEDRLARERILQGLTPEESLLDFVSSKLCQEKLSSNYHVRVGTRYGRALADKEDKIKQMLFSS